MSEREHTVGGRSAGRLVRPVMYLISACTGGRHAD